MKSILALSLTILSIGVTANTAGASYLDQAKSDIGILLSNPIFQSYSEYTIDNIRQGEIGESKAYFVRLVKPFSTDSSGVCVQFIGANQLSGTPHACRGVE